MLVGYLGNVGTGVPPNILKGGLRADHSITPTVMSSRGSSPTRGTCEASQDLIAGVTGGLSLGFLVFAPPAYDMFS